jgi:hypothetical protein
MPREPPVTSATFPASSLLMFVLILSFDLSVVLCGIIYVPVLESTNTSLVALPCFLGTMDKSFRLPLLSADHLNMAKLPETFFSELHSNARILIGGSRHERIPNGMLVNPHCPCLYLAGYSLKFV